MYMYFIYSISHILCFVYACLILFLYICFRFLASSADFTTKKKKKKKKKCILIHVFHIFYVVYYLFDFVFVNVFCYNYAHT